MKYLKLYESYNEIESGLFEIVWDCIDNTYPDKNDMIEELKSFSNDKDFWISFVNNCLLKSDRIELGSYFIKKYLNDYSNNKFYKFLSEKMAGINSDLSESIIISWGIKNN
jgi:hypothetical protein